MRHDSAATIRATKVSTSYFNHLMLQNQQYSVRYSARYLHASETSCAESHFLEFGLVGLIVGGYGC